MNVVSYTVGDRREGLGGGDVQLSSQAGLPAVLVNEGV